MINYKDQEPANHVPGKIRFAKRCWLNRFVGQSPGFAKVEGEVKAGNVYSSGKSILIEAGEQSPIERKKI